MGKVTITPQVADILERAFFAGNKLILPEQIARPDYDAVNKVITALGGKWNRHQGGHIFSGDAGELVASALEAGTVINKKDVLNQFYTPPALADYLVSKIPVASGLRILEPSAGTGALLAALARAGGMNDVTAIDIDPSHHADICDLIVADFLDWSETNEHLQFDAVIMNPPFSEQRDVRHILAAWSHLREGGRLVAIASSGVTFRKGTNATLLRELVKAYGTIEHLPDNSFAPATNVNTVMIVIDREKD